MAWVALMVAAEEQRLKKMNVTRVCPVGLCGSGLCSAVDSINSFFTILVLIVVSIPKSLSLET